MTSIMWVLVSNFRKLVKSETNQKSLHSTVLWNCGFSHLLVYEWYLSIHNHICVHIQMCTHECMYVCVNSGPRCKKVFLTVGCNPTIWKLCTNQMNQFPTGHQILSSKDLETSLGPGRPGNTDGNSLNISLFELCTQVVQKSTWKYVTPKQCSQEAQLWQSQDMLFF